MADYTHVLKNILDAIAGITGGGSSSITSNTAIEYGAGATTAKTQRMAIASDANSVTAGVKQDEFAETQLTAPSSTTARSMVGYNKACIQVTVASINTSVTLRIEGSNDGVGWDNLSSVNSDTVLTTNTSKLFVFASCPKFVRTTFVSETGGTNATVDVITRLSA